MIRVAEYVPNVGVRTDIDVLKVEPRGAPGGCLWVDFSEPTDDEIRVFREHFRFHPLAIEDCLNHKQRPKIDLYEDHAFVVIHSAPDFPAPGAARLGAVEFDVFLGQNFLVTFHLKELGFVREVFERVKSHPELMSRGPDILFHAIADTLVDEYFPVLDEMEEELQRLEEDLFLRPSNALINRIFHAKRKLLALRRILSPQREVFNQILRHDFPYMKHESRVFFADIYDHVLRLFDTVDIYQDIATGTIDAYLSVTSNRLNEIMKVLTVITTIMMPLTVITGIYGMNFKFMPELDWRLGYPWALGLMGTVGFVMLRYFRRKGWF